MKKIIFAGIACIITLLSGGCSDNAEEDNRFVICPGIEDEPWQGPQPLQKVAADNIDKSTGFATSLFKTIYAGEGENISISPISIFATFAMMANGDDGESREEILKILGYGDNHGSLSELNIYCNALLTEVPILNGATQCNFTNSIWHHPDVRLRPEFASAIQMIYDGQIFPTWIGDEEGRIKINEFVSDNTCGMIPEFLSSPLELRVAILNTTYFKGTWEKEFDSSATRKKVFKCLDGSKSEAEFMYREDEMEYFEAGDLKGIRLPYSGNRYDITFLLPNKAEDFEKMIKDLDEQTIKDIDSSVDTHNVILELPKFETEINLSLIGYLREIGFDKVCSTGILKAADETLVLTEFKHAVKIVVDEEGTEGAAASLAGLDNAVPNPTYRPIEISFDRPFVYIIRDTISGAILFMGAIKTPSNKNNKSYV